MPSTLTLERVREARLSPLPSDQIAEQLGVSVDMTMRLRSGRAYGPLRDDERAAHEARKSTRGRGTTAAEVTALADHFLLIGDLFDRNGLADQDRQEMKDAAHECAHGRLPHDRTPPCGCWPGERRADQPTQKEAVNGNHRARLARFVQQAGGVDSTDRPDADQPVHA